VDGPVDTLMTISVIVQSEIGQGFFGVIAHSMDSVLYGLLVNEGESDALGN
jgi:hypothetical protein